MAGISHDLQEAHADILQQRLAIVDDHISSPLPSPVTAMEELTRLRRHVPWRQIERYCKRIFHLTPRQMITKVRLQKKPPSCWRERPDYRYCAAVRLYRHSAFQPVNLNDDRLHAARFSPDAGGIIVGSHFLRLC